MEALALQEAEAKRIRKMKKLTHVPGVLVRVSGKAEHPFIGVIAKVRGYKVEILWAHHADIADRSMWEEWSLEGMNVYFVKESRLRRETNMDILILDAGRSAVAPVGVSSKPDARRGIRKEVQKMTEKSGLLAITDGMAAMEVD
jgi:hypothetical protein